MLTLIAPSILLALAFTAAIGDVTELAICAVSFELRCRLIATRYVDKIQGE